MLQRQEKRAVPTYMDWGARGATIPTASASAPTLADPVYPRKTSSRTCSACPTLFSRSIGAPPGASASGSRKKRTLSADPKKWSSSTWLSSPVSKVPASPAPDVCHSSTSFRMRCSMASRSVSSENPRTTAYPCSR